MKLNIEPPKTEWAKMLDGEPCDPLDEEIVMSKHRTLAACAQFNYAEFSIEAGNLPVTRRRKVELWRNIIGDKTPMPEVDPDEKKDAALFDKTDPLVEGPIWIMHGCQLKVGVGTRLGPNLIIENARPAIIGDRVFIGPNVLLRGEYELLLPLKSERAIWGEQIHFEEAASMLDKICSANATQRKDRHRRVFGLACDNWDLDGVLGGIIIPIEQAVSILRKIIKHGPGRCYKGKERLISAENVPAPGEINSLDPAKCSIEARSRIVAQEIRIDDDAFIEGDAVIGGFHLGKSCFVGTGSCIPHGLDPLRAAPSPLLFKMIDTMNAEQGKTSANGNSWDEDEMMLKLPLVLKDHPLMWYPREKKDRGPEDPDSGCGWGHTEGHWW